MRTILPKCFVLIFFLLFFSQCKKDYPDDIPKWVKTEIQNFKKVTPDCICHYSDDDINPQLSISEYIINSEKIYAFVQTCSYRGEYVTIFDNNGNSWNGCQGIGEVNYDNGKANCLVFVKSHCSSSRLIWSGKMY
ncbi:MAG: hypothetical protein WCM76_04295 [Bacteroidota bacterium]